MLSGRLSHLHENVDLTPSEFMIAFNNEKVLEKEATLESLLKYLHIETYIDKFNPEGLKSIKEFDKVDQDAFWLVKIIRYEDRRSSSIYCSNFEIKLRIRPCRILGH